MLTAIFERLSLDVVVRVRAGLEPEKKPLQSSCYELSIAAASACLSLEGRELDLRGTRVEIPSLVPCTLRSYSCGHFFAFFSPDEL